MRIKQNCGLVDKIQPCCSCRIKYNPIISPLCSLFWYILFRSKFSTITYLNTSSIPKRLSNRSVCYLLKRVHVMFCFLVMSPQPSDWLEVVPILISDVTALASPRLCHIYCSRILGHMQLALRGTIRS